MVIQVERTEVDLPPLAPESVVTGDLRGNKQGM